MKTRMNLFLCCSCLLVGVIMNATAQSKLHFFIGPGAAYYQGDIAESGLPDPRMIRLNVKAGLGYDFSPRWGLRLHGAMGSLKGSDSYTLDAGKVARGISFNTSIIDAGLTVKVNGLLNNRLKLENYFFAGVDYLNMQVARTVEGTGALTPERAFSNHQLNFPVGLGLGYWMTPLVGLFYEGSVHFVTSDYLDGTSLAGNPTAPDTYFDNHLLLVFRFGKLKRGGKDSFGNTDCPRF